MECKFCPSGTNRIYWSVLIKGKAKLQVLNIDSPIEFVPHSDGRGRRLCKSSHVTTCHLGTFCLNSSRMRFCMMFSSLLKSNSWILLCDKRLFTEGKLAYLIERVSCIYVNLDRCFTILFVCHDVCNL